MKVTLLKTTGCRPPRKSQAYAEHAMQNQGQVVDASMHRLTDLSETAHCKGQKKRVSKQGAGGSVNDGTHGTKTNALKHNNMACSTYSHACKVLVGLLGISSETENLAFLARENLCPAQHRCAKLQCKGALGTVAVEGPNNLGKTVGDVVNCDVAADVEASRIGVGVVPLPRGLPELLPWVVDLEALHTLASTSPRLLKTNSSGTCDSTATPEAVGTTYYTFTKVPCRVGGIKKQ